MGCLESWGEDLDELVVFPCLQGSLSAPPCSALLSLYGVGSLWFGLVWGGGPSA